MTKLEKAEKKLRKQLEQQDIQVIEKENKEYTKGLTKELNENVEFSLTVDPTNKYSMSDSQKAFVRHYVDFKSIPMAAELSGIDLDTAKSYYVAYSTQQEIRRLNRALYQRQFSNKLLTIDEIESWLSSLITDENVPVADRVKTMDKVKIAQMLIDLQLYKHDAINNPQNIIDVDIESQIKKLSIKSIKSLISQTNEKKDDKNMTKENLSVNMTPEEDAFLKTLPAKDVLNLMNDMTNENNINEKDNKTNDNKGG